MPRKKVIIIKAFIFTGQYMLPGDVRHEIRPIRMRYLQSDFCARKCSVMGKPPWWFECYFRQKNTITGLKSNKKKTDMYTNVNILN